MSLEGSKNKVITKLPVGQQLLQIIIFGYMEENHLKRIAIYLENY
jgi:hypothetical protein